MDEIERWKFEVRQAMLGYASAEKRGDSAAIEATSARACELVDELAAKISAERERNRNAGFAEASRMHGQEIERLRSALRLIHGHGGGDFASDIHEARAIARDALGPNVRPKRDTTA